MNVIDAQIDPWPEAISDGLTLPCSYCLRVPDVDWRTTDEEWARVVPRQYRLGVVCLACFVSMGGDPRLVFEIQVVVPGVTFACNPHLVVLWESRPEKKTIMARFIGTSRSLGYQTGAIYELLVWSTPMSPVVIRRVWDGRGFCPYASQETFERNWEVLDGRNNDQVVP